MCKSSFKDKQTEHALHKPQVILRKYETMQLYFPSPGKKYKYCNSILAQEMALNVKISFTRINYSDSVQQKG